MSFLGKKWPMGLLQQRFWAWTALTGYLLLALMTQSGANVVGAGLDPVWAGVQQRGLLRVAVDFGYAPFSGERAGQPYGYDIDLARALAERLGLDVEFVPSNLDSIYDDLSADRADVAISALPYAPEQGWRARFSTFYFNAGQVLVVPTESAITRDTLDGRRVGAAFGSDADALVRRLAREHPAITPVLTFETVPEAAAALRRGAIDAIIADNAAALSVLQGAPKLQLSAALTFEPYAIAMPARAFTLNDRINAALENLRRAGYFEQLGAKWFR